MRKSFQKLFGVAFLLTLVLLILIEWLINQSIKTEHILGWICVAIGVGALVGIILKKEDLSH